MRWLLLVLGLLLAGVPALGQTTTSVSGTITDAGAQAWANGTITFTFRPSNSNPTGQYFQGGVQFNKNTTIGPLPLDNTGSFTAALVPSNNTITPSGSTFTTQVCPAATTPCFSQNLTITGATQNISSSIIPPAVNLNLAVPLLGARAYTDSEVSGALPGTFYFNVTDNRLHICLLTGFPPCTWFVLNGGGGTVTSVSGLAPLFTVANPTTTPTFSQISQAQNLFYASPNGSSGVPTFRALVSADLPVGTGTVTTVSDFSPLFTTNTRTTTPAFVGVSQSANLAFISPDNASGVPTFRALVGRDLPNPGPTLTTGKGGVNSKAAVTHQFLTAINTDGSVSQAQPTTADISGLTGFTQIATASAVGCTTQGTSFSNCDVTMTWSSAFADTGYIPVCAVRDTTLQASGGDGSTGDVPNVPIRSFSATQITVALTTLAARSISGAANATIFCIGVHP